jgi:F-box and WD-40 domain protein 1/11
VLCLKFDKDWDIKQNDVNSVAEEEDYKPGFMVSGSSDCSICVWDLHSAKGGSNGDRKEEIRADLNAVLRGHAGGVLDLRIDERWIVSWCAPSLHGYGSSVLIICNSSKDALIRVWNRSNLALHTTFRGHEGPVNAVGLQSGRVVSASGDGKMMLWDIESGKRLRVFEGHDRGLACIEYKVCRF